MKKSLYIIYILVISLFASSCHEQEEFANDPYGNFDALWTNVDQHYCFFKYKNVDWEAIGQQYRAKLRPKMSSTELSTNITCISIIANQQVLNMVY